MPRFLIVTESVPDTDLRHALGDVGDRFPEVDVEPGDGDEPMICRAPSEAHVQRCMAAAGIGVRTISRV